MGAIIFEIMYDSIQSSSQNTDHTFTNILRSIETLAKTKSQWVSDFVALQKDILAKRGPKNERWVLHG
jgi:hypothetical protein